MKSLLRRGASRSTLVKLLAPTGRGIGRMFVSRAAFFGVYFKLVTSVCVFACGFRVDSAYNT